MLDIVLLIVEDSIEFDDIEERDDIYSLIYIDFIDLYDLMSYLSTI